MDRTWSPPAPLQHCDPLDGLRGLAVAAVLLFHAGYLRGGYLGVDLFFTISGFLITRLILDALARDRFTFKEFWLRRARRLLPAAWLMLLAVMVAGPVLVRPSELPSLRGDVVATFGYVANWWRMATSSSYFAFYGTVSPLQHTWSLAIEEQFYLVWPVVMAAIWKMSGARRGQIRVMLCVTAVLMIASVVLDAVLYDAADGGMRSYYGTDTRAASILIGGLASMLVWRDGQHMRNMQWQRLLAPVALAAIGVEWLVGDSGAWLYRGGLTASAIAAAIVLVAITTAQDTVVHRVLQVRPLVALGVISYGVYLFHWPIFEWLSPTRTGLHGIPLLTVRVVATIAVATLSFVFVERPYRQRRGPVSWRVAGAFTLAVVLVAVAVRVPVQKPLGTERAALVVHAIAAKAPTPVTTVPSPSSTTAPPPAPAPTHLVVVGDSVGQRLDKGFEHEAGPGVEVDDIATPFCGLGEEWPQMKFGDQLVDDRCADWRSAWPAAEDKFNADGTLVVFGIETSVRMIQGQWREACDPIYDAWLQSTVRDLVVSLGQHGPVWIALAPYNRADRSIDGSTVAQRDQHTDCTNRDYRAAALADSRAHIIDLAHFVCPDDAACTDVVEGIDLRPDGLHFQGDGEDVVARWLLDQVGDTAPHA